jgi:hypothetical protein
MDVAARQHVGELVADQFADAKLALRAAACLIVTLMTWHCFLFRRDAGFEPRVHILKWCLQSERGWLE